MEHRHYIILGAGPAGCQLGYFLARAKRHYLVVERGDAPGSFFARFPRHRKLISINKVHTGYDDPELNLRWDWNSLLSHDPTLRFGKHSERYFPDAADLVEYLARFAKRTKLAIRYGFDVQSIRLLRGRFVLTATSGERLSSDRLIVASGLGMPYVPEIDGIELAEQYAEMSLAPETLPPFPLEQSQRRLKRSVIRSFVG